MRCFLATVWKGHTSCAFFFKPFFENSILSILRIGILIASKFLHLFNQCFSNPKLHSKAEGVDNCICPEVCFSEHRCLMQMKKGDVKFYQGQRRILDIISISTNFYMRQQQVVYTIVISQILKSLCLKCAHNLIQALKSKHIQGMTQYWSWRVF